MDNTRKWIEDPLPSNCPPNDAIIPNHVEFYRLVETIPPTKEDFFSVFKLYPEKELLKSIDECIQRSCTLFSTLKDCDTIRKLPNFKTKIIIKITLPPECGLIKRTFKRPNHYSWWMTNGFDPVKYCKEE